LYTYVPFSKEATASLLALHIKTLVDTNKAQVNLETCSLYVSICNCVLCLELIVSVFRFGIWSAIRVHKSKNSQFPSQKGGLQPQTDELQYLITAIQCCHQAKRNKAV